MNKVTIKDTGPASLKLGDMIKYNNNSDSVYMLVSNPVSNRADVVQLTTGKLFPSAHLDGTIRVPSVTITSQE